MNFIIYSQINKSSFHSDLFIYFYLIRYYIVFGLKHKPVRLGKFITHPTKRVLFNLYIHNKLLLTNNAAV